jgi:hypothetical protein
MQKQNPPLVWSDGFGNDDFEHVDATQPPHKKQQFSVELMGTLALIAQFIYDAAPRPVEQIAMTGAIGLMAGICGRAYNVSGTGLNQYVLQLAPTGCGKEAIASGISKLMSALVKKAPTAIDFVGPTEIASPQAILKWLARAPCVYSIVGEFGLKLKEMSERNANANTAGLKRALLSLYHKSGNGDVLGAIAHAKREDNTAPIVSAAFTLIGESTPLRLYENVNEGMITEGLLSRFFISEYDGERVKLNKHHASVVPGEQLLDRLAEIVSQASTSAHTNVVNNVGISPEAETVLDEFERWTTAQINGARQSDITAELWNRAHLKAMKLAALYAVGCNFHTPIISEAQAQAACDEIYLQTTALKARFDNGEVGAIEESETARRDAILNACRVYLTSTFEAVQSYGVEQKLHAEYVIMYSYLQRRLAHTAPFKKAHGGGTNALNAAIKVLVDGGELSELSKFQTHAKYGFSCRAFMFQNLKMFL